MADPTADELMAEWLRNQIAAGGADGARTIRQGNDGQYYELVGNQWVLLPGMPGEADASGPLPGEGQPYDISDIVGTIQDTGGIQESQFNRFGTNTNRSQVVDDAAWRVRSGNYSDQDVSILKDAGLVTTDEASDLIFGNPGRAGGASDPYAGAANARAEAANARAERALQEQIRAQRLQESQSAADAIEARRIAAFNATMEAAGWALPQGMTHFPGLSPSSANVRSGIADPLAVRPITVAPGALGQGPNEAQILADLQRIRGAAGV